MMQRYPKAQEVKRLLQPMARKIISKSICYGEISYCTTDSSEMSFMYFANMQLLNADV